MIERMSASELEGMRRAGAVAAATLDAVCRRIEAGIRLDEIDAWVRADTKARGARPSQLGYEGFPAAVCVSPNEVVCHGVPHRGRVLREGDIVNVDVTSEFGGFHGDTSRMVCVGEVSPLARRLVETTRAALEAGIAAARPGRRLGEVCAEIQRVVHAAGFELVREYGGHGIGRRMHQSPHVDHGAPPRSGPRLRPGMCFTLEPIVVLGHPRLRVLDDGWTVVTEDASPSAQFEHTLAVVEGGVEVLTRFKR